MSNLYPLLFTPVLKDYIWGGRNLEKLGRTLPPGITAESWEIAAHEDGTTAVANGRYQGMPLTQLQQQLGLDLIGHNAAWAHARGKFPLLIKLLDANQPLSVQVHPQDDYARQHEGNELGKTEMWVVLQAKPGAQVQMGVKQGTTPQQFGQALHDGRLEPFLHYLPVQAGDHICVPAGTLHAIMDGILLAEIQQNSNTTYRVYDWNRRDAQGNTRPLHIQKALDVINFAQVEPVLCPPQPIIEQAGLQQTVLCANDYFVTERLQLAAGSQFHCRCDGRSLEIWGLLQGQASLNHVPLTAVQFVLLPAALGPYTLQAHEDCTLLRTYIGPL